jgi:hypothetical protein
MREEGGVVSMWIKKKREELLGGSEDWRRRAWRLCLRMMESGRGRIRGGSGARERRRLSTSEKEKETEMEADGKWGC